MGMPQVSNVSLADEERYRLLVDAISDYAIYLLDADGNVATWNPGAQRFKRYEAHEILGKHFSVFYTDEDRANGEPEKGLETARQQGRFEKEGRRQRKDGTRFWAHVVIDAIRGDNGEIIGFAKVTRDITEKIEAQKALAQAREDLFQSQKMEAIGQLTGGMAHDFNNLLMAVLGSLEILKKRMPEDPALLPLVENAIRGAERGAALTQRMLAFSRRQELNMQAIRVETLVDGMMDFIRGAIGPSIRIETDIAADLPMIVADPVQLETALLNLVVNARDAMPRGGTVTITANRMALDGTEDRLRPGDYVCLIVSDTGEGMDADIITQATTPFFTTKGVGKGTGLGLSMVQGLTEQCGGKLMLDSVLGEGTTIRLCLPAAGTDTTLQTGIETMKTQPAPAMKQHLTVLAVDDDALVLMNTTLMLEDLGHTVVEAYSGADALQAMRAAEQPFDLVITDHSMPRMTGSELAAEIRAGWPGLPVVLATGYAELPSGGDNRLPRLPKPFSQSQLEDVIASVLGSTG